MVDKHRQLFEARMAVRRERDELSRNVFAGDGRLTDVPTRPEGAPLSPTLLAEWDRVTRQVAEAEAAFKDSERKRLFGS